MNAKRQVGLGFSTAIRRAHDPCAHSTCATGWSHVFEQLTPGPFEGTTHEALLGPIQIAYEHIECGFSYRGRPWIGSRVFFSYLSDSVGPYIDCRPVPGDIVVSHRWDAVERVISPRATRLVVIAIDEAFMQEQLSQLLECGACPPSLAAVTSTADPQRVRLFQTCVTDVIHELEQRPQLIDEVKARAEFRARVIDTLADLISPSTDMSRNLPPPTTRAYVVRRATQIMEARIADTLSVTELCREIRVCPRTLRYSFIEVTGISPTQYLLAMRLNAVRRQLADRDNHSPVQVVAARWGFWHMGRFARYYRLAFGERPSDTALIRMNSAVRPRTREVCRADRSRS